MWLKELKAAVVQKDTKQLEKLLENIPTLENSKEIETALYLFEEAKRIVEGLKKETAASMAQMKKNIEFLSSTTADKKAKFDVTS